MRKVFALMLTLAVATAVVATAAQARSDTAQGMYGIQITNYKVNASHTVTINNDHSPLSEPTRSKTIPVMVDAA